MRKIVQVNENICIAAAGSLPLIEKLIFQIGIICSDQNISMNDVINEIDYFAKTSNYQDEYKFVSLIIIVVDPNSHRIRRFVRNVINYTMPNGDAIFLGGSGAEHFRTWLDTYANGFFSTNTHNNKPADSAYLITSLCHALAHDEAFHPDQLDHAYGGWFDFKLVNSYGKLDENENKISYFIEFPPTLFYWIRVDLTDAKPDVLVHPFFFIVQHYQNTMLLYRCCNVEKDDHEFNVFCIPEVGNSKIYQDAVNFGRHNPPNIAGVSMVIEIKDGVNDRRLHRHSAIDNENLSVSVSFTPINFNFTFTLEWLSKIIGINLADME